MPQYKPISRSVRGESEVGSSTVHFTDVRTSDMGATHAVTPAAWVMSCAAKYSLYHAYPYIEGSINTLAPVLRAV